MIPASVRVIIRQSKENDVFEVVNIRERANFERRELVDGGRNRRERENRRSEKAQIVHIQVWENVSLRFFFLSYKSGRNSVCLSLYAVFLRSHIDCC